MANSRTIFIHLLIVITCAFGFLLLVEAKSEISEIRDYTTEVELPLLGMTSSLSFDKLALKYKNAGEHLLDGGIMRDWILGGEKDTGKILDFIEGVDEKYNLMDASLVSDLSEMYYCTDGRILHLSPLNTERDGWYYYYRQNVEDTNIDSWYHPENGILELFVNIPVRDRDGKFLGVTGCGVDSSVFDSMLKNIENEWNVSLFLVRNDGRLIYASDAELLASGEVSVNSIWNYNIFDQLVRRKNEPKGVVVQPGSGYTLVWGGYMPEWDSYLLVERGNLMTDKIRSVIRRTILFEIMLTLLMLLVTGGVLRLTYLRAMSSLDSGRRAVHHLQALMYIQDSVIRRLLALNQGVSGGLRKSDSEMSRIRQYYNSIRLLKGKDVKAVPGGSINLNEIINDLVIENIPKAERRRLNLVSRLRSSLLVVSGNEAVVGFVIEEILEYALVNAVEGSEIILITGKGKASVFVEATYPYSGAAGNDAGFDVLRPLLKEMQISLDLKCTGNNLCIIRAEFQFPGE